MLFFAVFLRIRRLPAPLKLTINKWFYSLLSGGLLFVLSQLLPGISAGGAKHQIRYIEAFIRNYGLDIEVNTITSQKLVIMVTLT